MDNGALKVALSPSRFVIGFLTANTMDNVFRFNIAHPLFLEMCPNVSRNDYL